MCNSASISSAASHWVLLLTVAQVTPSILVATAMGSFSDRYGRKTSLVLATASSVVESALLVAVEVMPLAPSTVRMALLGGEVVVGFMGAYSLFFMAVFSMVVDSIQRGQRTLLIGFMEGVIYLGKQTGLIDKRLAFCPENVRDKREEGVHEYESVQPNCDKSNA